MKILNILKQCERSGGILWKIIQFHLIWKLLFIANICFQCIVTGKPINSLPLDGSRCYRTKKENHRCWRRSLRVTFLNDYVFMLLKYRYINFAALTSHNRMSPPYETVACQQLNLHEIGFPVVRSSLLSYVSWLIIYLKYGSHVTSIKTKSINNCMRNVLNVKALTVAWVKTGALSLLSVTVRITLAFPDKPSPSMSAASTLRVYFGYFCWTQLMHIC